MGDKRGGLPMRTDGYTRALLTIIALALVVIAVRPLLVPVPSHAARKIEYKLVSGGLSDDQTALELNQLGNAGWEAVAATPRHVILKR